LLSLPIFAKRCRIKCWKKSLVCERLKVHIILSKKLPIFIAEILLIIIIKLLKRILKNNIINWHPKVSNPEKVLIKRICENKNVRTWGKKKKKNITQWSRMVILIMCMSDNAHGKAPQLRALP
jgi:hypothetical protein